MSNLTIEVWDATGNKKQLVELPADASVNRVISVLVEKMNLLRYSPGGETTLRQGRPIKAGASVRAVGSARHLGWSHTQAVVSKLITTRFGNTSSGILACN